MGIADTFKALGSPVRREILVLLRGGRLSAGEIGEHFSMTGATISHHLSQLKKADLVFEIKEKNFVYYELNATVFEEVMLWVAQFREGENDEGK
ncbi:MAG: winged helix-turn-helix transcriptional regulator [Firmicutes bacterium]|nr:winged helix-turn-helix transcriptional regulator [Bacillota bacterium]MBR3786713.1 winged helix-turn-helix transcriptional regulator [Bacillota bacterium]MBR4019915.1 winged helix-turn-helix transcriptional regulator [Bacillota bacterium]